MEPPATPSNEHERLAALKALDILDTESEERFDRLTRLAKRLFDVPIALVSLVDSDRQWFKSCHGLSARETPRDISFCGHTILGDEPMVVTDTLNDPRFSDNPLVTDEPHIRFYAGYPLSTIDGYKLGTLCLIDRQPRQFDSDDHAALQDLAQMAESELAAVQLATLDSLTGLSNRRGFELLAGKALDFCRRQQTPATIAFVDLNNFKHINDQYGHEQGDQVLQAFARVLLDSLRDSDVVGRLGGDEFALLFANASEQQAQRSMARVSEAMQQLPLNRQLAGAIRFSCGLVEIDPAQSGQLDSLLQQADQRMYREKRQGCKP